MILKSFETHKINLKKPNLILFYGKNEGHKKATINQIIENKENTIVYEQQEILDNADNFFDTILSKSLFEKNKTIIIKRANDKIVKIIDDLNLDKLEDINIIIEADNLEKKSKLRSNFEKNKDYICVAFYPDTQQTLIKLAHNFLRESNISISQSNINLIIDKCLGSRESLFNELNKIVNFTKNGKKITEENILKLINLNENHSISELIDNCLAKNKIKIMHILNENNFNYEDSVVIVRTLLNKSKKILKLIQNYENNNNIELTISSARPPIFWKDKEITKQQIYKWKSQNIKKFIYEISEVELLIKKNFNNSINLITNFILEKSTSETNN